jgi:ATP-binding cassette subfamily B protein
MAFDNFKFYKQLDKMDCGPSCLKMVAKHYGEVYSVEFLRDKSAISNQGVTLYGLSKAAENIGFRTLNAKVNFDNLHKLIFPFIAYWNKSHFVVVYKMDDKKVYLADPAIGKLSYKKEEFLKHWAINSLKEEGNVLILEPTPLFYSDNLNKRSSESSVLSSLIHFTHYLRPYKFLIFQIFIGLLVGSFVQLLLPFLSLTMIDKGINGNNVKLIYLILASQLALNFAMSITAFVRSWLFLHIGTKINIAIISDFLIRVLDLPISFFDTRSVGDLLQRISDNSRIESFLTGSFLNVIFSIVTFGIFGVILYSFNKPIFITFLIGNAAFILWILAFQNFRKKLDHKSFDMTSRNTSTLVQLFDGIQDIKLSNSEKAKRWDWEKLQASIYEVKRKTLLTNQAQSTGSLFINQTKNIFISFLAAKSVIDGDITFGMMIATNFIVAQANAPINEFVNFIRTFQMAEISFRRLNEIYSKRKDSDTNENYITIMPEKKDIVFTNVDYSYSKKEDDLTLSDLNFKIPQGKVTAIVGSSGSGKTTLVKLLLKFYFPAKGNITIGGVNFSNVNPYWWNENCGAVLQDSFIFSDTIAKNICLGFDNIDRDRLVQSTKLANIQSFIEELPFGYNTRIGKGGQGISQGQKQRILIARVLYKNPEFVFLDEATNALDSENESEIMQNLKLQLKGKTTVIVAHRLSTILDADNIVVLKKGKIVEQGTHEELLNKKGNYYHLILKQLK